MLYFRHTWNLIILHFTTSHGKSRKLECIRLLLWSMHYYFGGNQRILNRFQYSNNPPKGTFQVSVCRNMLYCVCFWSNSILSNLSKYIFSLLEMFYSVLLCLSPTQTGIVMSLWFAENHNRAFVSYFFTCSGDSVKYLTPFAQWCTEKLSIKLRWVFNYTVVSKQIWAQLETRLRSLFVRSRKLKRKPDFAVFNVFAVFTKDVSEISRPVKTCTRIRKLWISHCVMISRTDGEQSKCALLQSPFHDNAGAQTFYKGCGAFFENPMNETDYFFALFFQLLVSDWLWLHHGARTLQHPVSSQTPERLFA